MSNKHVQPYVQILEQPVKFVRFRYESEKKWVSSIPGVSSTSKNKTFPSIRIVGYKGRAKVVVSCVTKDLPYTPHPHSIVGKRICKQGICTVETGDMDVIFSNLGIQCVKKKDIEEAFKVRQELQIDPFETGFEHPVNIDLNAVRLCFEVYLEGSQKGTFNERLDPIVSDPIYHEKTTNLVICKLSHYKATIDGWHDIILLCEKVSKKDINVRFFEEREGKLVWEEFAIIQQVYKQVAIVFWTPKYHSQEITHPVKVYVQLQRPSDNATSEPQLFEMLPLPTGFYLSRKPCTYGSGYDVKPHVQILEQPIKFVRFRYKSEEKWISSIPGVNSTPEHKTFPSIRIVGYNGRAKVVVSCVTKDAPYKPHPHSLVGKEVCKQGICTIEVKGEERGRFPINVMDVIFSNLGIQCVKVKDVEEALNVRRELRVDPFETGFEYLTSIDLNIVRLCFEVYLEGSQEGTFNERLDPIVSNPIYHEKVISKLEICKLSHFNASVDGGLEMILLCEQIDKKDIKVRFFEEKNGELLWEGFGKFQPTHVHKQVAIVFCTPEYHSREVTHPVQVYIQLQRPSDNATSESQLFEMFLSREYDPIDEFLFSFPSTSAEREQTVRPFLPKPFRPLKQIEFPNDNWNTIPPKPTPLPNDNWNNYTLPPIQPWHHQPFIRPTMSQPNVPVPINLKLLESDQSYQPELNLSDVNETTPENRAVQPGNMFGREQAVIPLPLNLVSPVIPSKRTTFPNDNWNDNNTVSPPPSKRTPISYDNWNDNYTIPPVSSKPTSFPNDNWNDNHTVFPMPLQYQSASQPIIPQSNTPAPINRELFENLSDQSHKPELNLLDVNGSTPENQAVQSGIIIDSAEIPDILDSINTDVNSTNLMSDVETNLLANHSELSMPVFK